MSRWGRLFSRRKRMMEGLDQDIRDYIERETQDNIDRGMSPEEARYAALRKFGNVTRVKEETWDVWSFVWLERLWQDVRFGLRMLRKNPAVAGEESRSECFQGTARFLALRPNASGRRVVACGSWE